MELIGLSLLCKSSLNAVKWPDKQMYESFREAIKYMIIYQLKIKKKNPAALNT